MAIRAVENGAMTMIETGASASLMENLPVLDSLSKETLIRQADKCVTVGASWYSSTRALTHGSLW